MKMKKTILAGLLFALLASSAIILMSFKSSVQEENFLFVRTSEATGKDKIYNSVIIVTDGSKIIESIELGAPRAKNEANNVLTIASVLKGIQDKGYFLVSSNGDHLASNYVFQKK